MHSDDYLTDVGIVNSMPKIDKVLIIACGALAREIIDLIKLNNWHERGRGYVVNVGLKKGETSSTRILVSPTVKKSHRKRREGLEQEGRSIRRSSESGKRVQRSKLRRTRSRRRKGKS